MKRSFALKLVLALALGGAWACDDDDDSGNNPVGGTGGSIDGGNGGGDTGGTIPGQTCARTFVYRHTGFGVPTEVKLAGDFEEWQGSIPMTAVGNGFYTATTDVSVGAHAYKFVVDGQWVADGDNPNQPTEGDGNSTIDHVCPFTPTCVTNAECSGETPHCRFYACVACDCADGYECDATGACVPEPECRIDDDCPAPGRCRDGACGPECLDETDCADGDLCREGTCATPECLMDVECPDYVTQKCQDQFCVERPCTEHVFTFSTQEAFDTLHVAGSFNNWPATIEGGGLPMRIATPGTYFAVAEGLDDGAFQYKFVGYRNSQAIWMTDEANPERVSDNYGGFNSVFNVECDRPECEIDDDCEGEEVCRAGQCVPGGDIGPCGDVTAFDWRDAVMYFALVDRFYDSDGQAQPVNGASGMEQLGASGQYEGGDLQGMVEKLPYLEDLGITSVWLSAPYDNRDAAGAAIDANADRHMYSGYHGYWPAPANVNYSDPDNPSPVPAVETKIGTAADLHALVDGAHERDMTVLFDYVMNHVDINSGLYQAHQDWFARGDNGNFRLCGPENLWDDPYWGVRCAFTDYLPAFDYELPAPRAWSVNDAIWWAKAFNIDGFRLDAIKHVPLVWLTDLRTALKNRIQEMVGNRFYLVGETFTYGDRGLIGRFINANTMLDGQFDFPLKAQLCEAIFRWGDMDNFARWTVENDNAYGQLDQTKPWNERPIMTTWIGNHDIPRAIHFASRQIENCMEGSHSGNGWTSNFAQPQDAAPYERLGLAFAVLMTSPGIPLIYYGDEIGLAGGGDPDNRRMMPWNGLNQHQTALRNDIKKLIAIRKANKVLSRGMRSTVAVHREQGWWIYKMTGCGLSDVLVAINRNDEPRTVPIPAGSYTNLMTDQAAQGGDTQVPARDFLILRAE